MAGGGGVTSRDVAAAAGVSQSTVSRVINGRAGVERATRDKVLRAIRKLNYTPNAMARGLVTRSSGLVGVIASDVTNPFYPQFLEAIGQRLARTGIRMLLWNADHQSQDELLKSLFGQRLDGVIFTSAKHKSRLVQALHERGMPVVLTNRYVTNVECDTAVGDNDAGARSVARHLVELGHTRIAVLSGDPESTTSSDRMKGFRAELQSLNVVLQDEYIEETYYRYEDAYEATKRLLVMTPRPTAVFGLSDLTAVAAMNAAMALNISVPRSLTIIGFDDIALAAWESFKLTTVHQPYKEMAEAAVDLLLERLAHPTRSSRRLIFPSQLVVRGSSAKLSSAIGKEDYAGLP